MEKFLNYNLICLNEKKREIYDNNNEYYYRDKISYVQKNQYNPSQNVLNKVLLSDNTVKFLIIASLQNNLLDVLRYFNNNVGLEKNIATKIYFRGNLIFNKNIEHKLNNCFKKYPQLDKFLNFIFSSDDNYFGNLMSDSYIKTDIVFNIDSFKLKQDKINSILAINSFFDWQKFNVNNNNIYNYCNVISNNIVRLNIHEHMNKKKYILEAINNSLLLYKHYEKINDTKNLENIKNNMKKLVFNFYPEHENIDLFDKEYIEYLKKNINFLILLHDYVVIVVKLGFISNNVNNNNKKIYLNELLNNIKKSSLNSKPLIQQINTILESIITKYNTIDNITHFVKDEILINIQKYNHILNDLNTLQKIREKMNNLIKSCANILFTIKNNSSHTNIININLELLYSHINLINNELISFNIAIKTLNVDLVSLKQYLDKNNKTYLEIFNLYFNNHEIIYSSYKSIIDDLLKFKSLSNNEKYVNFDKINLYYNSFKSVIDNYESDYAVFRDKINAELSPLFVLLKESKQINYNDSILKLKYIENILTETTIFNDDLFINNVTTKINDLVENGEKIPNDITNIKTNINKDTNNDADSDATDKIKTTVNKTAVIETINDNRSISNDDNRSISNDDNRSISNDDIINTTSSRHSLYISNKTIYTIVEDIKNYMISENITNENVISKLNNVYNISDKDNNIINNVLLFLYKILLIFYYQIFNVKLSKIIYTEKKGSIIGILNKPCQNDDFSDNLLFENYDDIKYILDIYAQKYNDGPSLFYSLISSDVFDNKNITYYNDVFLNIYLDNLDVISNVFKDTNKNQYRHMLLKIPITYNISIENLFKSDIINNSKAIYVHLILILLFENNDILLRDSNSYINIINEKNNITYKENMLKLPYLVYPNKFLIDNINTDENTRSKINLSNNLIIDNSKYNNNKWYLTIDSYESLYKIIKTKIKHENETFILPGNIWNIPVTKQFIFKSNHPNFNDLSIDGYNYEYLLFIEYPNKLFKHVEYPWLKKNYLLKTKQFGLLILTYLISYFDDNMNFSDKILIMKNNITGLLKFVDNINKLCLNKKSLINDFERLNKPKYEATIVDLITYLLINLVTKSFTDNKSSALGDSIVYDELISYMSFFKTIIDNVIDIFYQSQKIIIASKNETIHSGQLSIGKKYRLFKTTK